MPASWADLTREQKDKRNARDRERRAADPEYRDRKNLQRRASYARVANDPERRERRNEIARQRQRERYSSDTDFRERSKAKHRKWARNRYATDPINRARVSLESQERQMMNREKTREIVRNCQRRRRAAAQAEWNEIMAEIQGASNV